MQDNISQAGGAGVTEANRSSAASVTPRTSNPLGTFGMRLDALDNAPCQSVVLSEEDAIDARCRHGLAHHPVKVGEWNVSMHEDAAGTMRWWIDSAGDIHLARKPGAQS